MKTLRLPFLLLLLISFTACESETNKDQPEDQSGKEQESATKTDTEESNVPNEEVVEASITYGIDISKYQGDEMSLLSDDNDSLKFVLCRSTEGVTYTDPDFKNNWKRAKEKGFVRGAYHFYRSNNDPEAQAKNYINAISDLGDQDFPPIIDFEEQSIAEGAEKEKVIEDLWKFIFIIEKETGRMPIIYTDLNIGNEYLTAYRFANYTLWIADYTSAETPSIPGAWKGMDWVLWQKSDAYSVDNILNDFDAFNGNLDALKKFISSTVLQ